MLDSARPSSPTPVKQEETAAPTLQVRAEMPVVQGFEQDIADVIEGPVGALSHMRLGTQVSGEPSHQRDPSMSPPRSAVDDREPCLQLDLAKPVAELMGQMRTQLSPTLGLVPRGMRVPLLSNEDVVVLRQWNDRVGLVNLLTVQPKQVTCLGVRGLVQALRGVKIQLAQPEDNDSDTSEMGVSHASLLLDHSETEPLALNRRIQNGKKENSQITPLFQTPWIRTTSWVMEITWIGVWPVTLVPPLEGLATFSPRKWTLRSSPQRLKVTPIGPWRARTHGTSVMVLTLIGAKEQVRRPCAIDCILRYNPI